MLATKNAGARGGLASVILLCLALVSGCAPSGSKVLLEGKRQFDAGNLPAAIVQFQKAVELLPTNAVAWSYLGLAQHKTGKFEEGRRAYQTALDRNPNLVEVRYNLGCLLLDAGQPAEAVPMLASFTVFQPGSLPGWQRLALAQMRSRQWDAAEKSAQQILRLSPGNAEAINHLGLIAVQRRRFADAAGLFTSAVQSQPGYRPAILNLAVVSHQYLNRKPAALQRYREYLALDTASPVHKEVLATLQQLEAELAAPARPNPLTVAATNAIHALTNAMAAAGPAVRSNPPPAVAHTPPATQKVAALTNTPVKPSPAPNGVPPAVQVVSVPTPAASAPAAGATVTEPKASVASASPAPSGGVPAVPATQKPVVVTKPVEPTKAPEPKLEPEIVKVVESEPIVAAPAAPVRETAPAPVTTTPVAPPAAAAKPAPAPTAGEEEEIGSAPDRQGLLGRINPKNWFKGRERTPTPLVKGGGTRSEPLPAGAASAPATLPASAAPTPAPAVAAVKPPVVAAAPVPAVVPQYVYRNPSPRPRGDRDAAQKQVLRGLQEQKERRLKEAMAAFESAAKTDPTCFEAHYNLGVAALDAGDVAVALSAYEEALALNGTSLPARFNFSLALERGGYFKDAAAQVEKAIQSSPSDARLHYAAGVLYAQRLNQKDLARAHYQKLLEIEPNHPQAVNIRYWLAANR